MKESTSDLIKKEVGVDVAKLSEEDKAKGKNSIGNLSMEQIVKIAKLKQADMLARDLKRGVKQVIGVASSLQGLLIEGKKPKEIIEEIDEGKWDEKIK